MAGPWEKYAQPQGGSPWEKYAKESMKTTPPANHGSKMPDIGSTMQEQSPGLTQAVYGPSDESTGLKESGYPGPAASEINPYTSSAAMAVGPAAIAGKVGAQQLVKHPIIGATVASEGIRAARNIPYVGKLIPPYSELLPFLLGGKGGAAAEGEAAAGAPKPPVAEPVASGPAPAAPPRSAFPPEKATTNFQMPKIRTGRGELNEDQGIQEMMRNDLEQHGRTAYMENSRQKWAANTRQTPKGVLVEQAGGSVPQSPVKFTKTPGVKSAPIAPPPSDDLTGILTQSLEQAKKKRGLK